MGHSCHSRVPRLMPPDAVLPEPIELPDPLEVRVLTKNGTVVVVGLEEYLNGVVPAEMGVRQVSQPVERDCISSECPYHMAHTEQAALSALAVWARTYVLYRIEHPQGDNYDVTSGAYSQVYMPSKTRLRSNMAVDATRGVFLVDVNGELPFIEYTACAETESCAFCDPPQGYDAERWHGRACQIGANMLAQDNMQWRALSTYYFSDLYLSDEWIPADTTTTVFLPVVSCQTTPEPLESAIYPQTGWLLPPMPTTTLPTKLLVP